MFGFGGGAKKAREKAIGEITENLRFQLAAYIKFGNLVELITTDAYVAGYINGKLTSLIVASIKSEGVASEDANMISGMVLINLFGEEKVHVVSQAIKSHSARGTPRHLEGRDKGIRIVTYALGTQDVRKDPDYARAIAATRRMEREAHSGVQSDEHLAAVIGLEHLWLGEYLGQN